jgi:hypothetical protein
MESQVLSSLARDGFVVIPSILTPSDLTVLRNASQETASIARSGGWAQVRTLPKQFPPWIITPGANPAAEGIWGVQGLMNPALPSYQAFVESYFSDGIMDVAKELLSCADDELVMELFNMLVRPDRDFELRWHRDDIPATASSDEELERLKKPAFHAQWNLALYDDASLIVVPGSHARAQTAAERAADPFEKELPGQLVVKLAAGDAVFYNNNILHRGAYDSKIERMTLHGSVGHVKGSALRARNVLQHGIGEWVEKCDFSSLDDKQRVRAEGMRKRLIELGKVSGDVGYSQEE